jgi:hypothetical protein
MSYEPGEIVYLKLQHACEAKNDCEWPIVPHLAGSAKPIGNRPGAGRALSRVCGGDHLVASRDCWDTTDHLVSRAPALAGTQGTVQ